MEVDRDGAVGTWVAARFGRGFDWSSVCACDAGLTLHARPAAKAGAHVGIELRGARSLVTWDVTPGEYVAMCAVVADALAVARFGHAGHRVSVSFDNENGRRVGVVASAAGGRASITMSGGGSVRCTLHLKTEAAAWLCQPHLFIGRSVPGWGE